MFLRRQFLDGATLSVLEDVMQNLRWIFGTRRGSGYFLEDFGVGDAGFRTPAEMVVSMTDEIKQNIRLYEPRVEVIDVDEDWDEAGKQSKLIVRLRLRDQKEKLEVVVDMAERSFDVRPVSQPAAARGPVQGT